ncbi:MAG: BolA family transcriptional regulator [Pseudomonadales bacterium]|nr:BolA family transcriptional regulator [Pseudomonadales bacterium]
MTESAVQAGIEFKLGADLNPSMLLVENESHMHGGPATESHYRITVVSDCFVPMSRVQRHQHAYKLLADEFAGGVHALALHLYTASEWQDRNKSTPSSPDCRGGSKFES